MQEPDEQRVTFGATIGLVLDLPGERRIAMSRREDFAADGSPVFVGWQLLFANQGNETRLLLSDEAVNAIDELRSEVLHAIRCNRIDWHVDVLNPRRAEPADAD